MTTREIAGKELLFDEDGFLADSSTWDKDVATQLAAEIGISPLTDRHWTVIEFCRTDYEAQGDAPTYHQGRRRADQRTVSAVPEGTGQESCLRCRPQETVRLHLVEQTVISFN